MLFLPPKSVFWTSYVAVASKTRAASCLYLPSACVRWIVGSRSRSIASATSRWVQAVLPAVSLLCALGRWIPVSVDRFSATSRWARPYILAPSSHLETRISLVIITRYVSSIVGLPCRFSYELVWLSAKLAVVAVECDFFFCSSLLRFFRAEKTCTKARYRVDQAGTKQTLNTKKCC